MWLAPSIQWSSLGPVAFWMAWMPAGPRRGSRRVRAAPLQQQVQALLRAQGDRCRGGGPGHGEPLAAAQNPFGLGSQADEHRATVVGRVHGVVLPPEVERRTAGDREDDGPAYRPLPADQYRAGTHQRDAEMARNREVDHLADRVGTQEPGHEHVSTGLVQLPGPDCLGPDCEAAAAVRV